MTILSITSFSGVAPKLPARSLPDNMAQTAINCNLLNGVLKPFAGPSATLFTSVKSGYPNTIYRFGQAQEFDTGYWFNWTTDVDVVKGPVAGDTNERTYFTGAGYPRMTTSSWALGVDYPNDSRLLGVPAPTSAPSLTLMGTGTGTASARVYVYTYVTDLMEEGPPSPASAQVSVASGQYVDLTGFITSVSGYPGVNRIRIYRSLAGTATTKYQKVGEFVLGINVAPWSGTTYSDSVADTALGTILPSTDYAAPPATMQGICALANGTLAGFNNNEVWCCEPYMPHAWPYFYALEYNVVAIAPIAGQSIAVATKGYPYIGTGAHPKNMTFSKLPQSYACVAKQSMVSIGGAALYASNDGLVMLSSQGAQLATAALFTRAEWAQLNPSSFRAYHWQGRYICFYTDTSGTKGGFIFDPTLQAPQFVYLNFYARAGYYDPLFGYLYLVIGDTKAVVRFDHTGLLTYTWKSKKFHTPDLTNFACAQVLAESYATPLVFNYYADGVLQATHAVTSSEAFRLPAGFTARDHEIELVGTSTVYAVHVAQHMAELKRV